MSQETRREFWIREMKHYQEGIEFYLDTGQNRTARLYQWYLHQLIYANG